MKQKYFALVMAFAMALALTGCSAGRNDNNAEVQSTNSMTSDAGDRASAGVGDAQNSAGLNNDAAQGGGAGGTNYDQNNVDGTGMNPSDGDDVIDDIGDAAGDLTRGVGNAARSAGNAVGNATRNAGNAVGNGANNVGGTMR